MPGRILILKGGKARVRWGGRTTAKHTTKAKARRQLNLLHAVKHGWKPTGKRARR